MEFIVHSRSVIFKSRATADDGGCGGRHSAELNRLFIQKPAVVQVFFAFFIRMRVVTAIGY